MKPNEIIRKTRESHGLNLCQLADKIGISMEELGDIIGFETWVIEEIENEPDALDHVLPYSEIITLSKTLDIPMSTLI